MTEFYLIPTWFFGFSSLLELFFGLITLGVALYAFYVNRFCDEREIKLFGYGFLAIALSYFSWAFVNWYVPFKASIQEEIFRFNNYEMLVSLGVYAHVFLFLIGLVTLVFLTMRREGNRLYSLLVILSFLIIVFSEQKIISFYFVSSLLLFYMIYHYGREFYEEGGKHNALMLLAFIFLFIASVDFTFSAINHIHFVAGHILFLIGYLFILFNLVLMVKPFLRKQKQKNG